MPLDLAAAIKAIDGGVRLTVRAQPRASREGIVAILDDGEGGVAMKIAVTAPPIDGEANAALVKLLAKILRVPRRDVRVTSGESARTKRIDILGVERDDVIARVRASLV